MMHRFVVLLLIFILICCLFLLLFHNSFKFLLLFFTFCLPCNISSYQQRGVYICWLLKGALLLLSFCCRYVVLHRGKRQAGCVERVRWGSGKQIKKFKCIFTWYSWRCIHISHWAHRNDGDILCSKCAYTCVGVYVCPVALSIVKTGIRRCTVS